MPALTWRNVDAPDFRGVMEGYRGFGDTINTALSRLSQGIEKFDDNKSDAVNKLVQAQLLQFQDPEQYKAALQSGQLINALGSNAGRLDGQTISAMGNRVNTLLEQQYKGLQAKDLTADIDYEGYTRDRTKDENSNLDALKPFASRIASGDPTLAKDAGYLKAMSGLSVKNQFETLTGGQSVRIGEKDIFGKELNNQSAQFKLTIDKRTDAEAQAIKAIGSELMGLGTEDDVMAALQKVAPEYRGGAYMYYKGLGMSNASGGGSSSGGGAGFSGNINLDTDRSSVASTLSGSGLPPAVVAGFMGNFEIEGGYGGAQGDGGTASGIAQWRHERRANFKNMFGKDPHQASKADQAKFVAWEMQNPEKAGMTVGQRDAILRAKTPEEAADLIDRHYERSSGAHRTARVQAAAKWSPNIPGLMGQNISTGIQAGVSGDRNAELFQSFQKLSADTSSDNAISARYTGKDGAFAGMDRGVVLDKIREVRQKYGVNAAVAADILERSTQREGLGSKIWDTFDLTSSNKSGLVFNEDDIARNGNLFKNGARGLRNAGTSLSIAAQANASAQNAPAIVAKLQANIAALARRGQRSPSLEAQRDAALAQMGGTFAGTAEVATALNREPQKPQRQQAPVRQAAPAPKPVSRPAQVIAAAARPADVRAGPKRPNDPGYAAEQAKKNPVPAAQTARRPQAETGPAATARALSAAGTVIANALRSPNANSNRERAQLRNALNGLDDMIARGGGWPVGTTRAQILQQRNALAGQLGIPLRR